MKFKIAVLLGLACFAAVCLARPADDYDYDDGASHAKPAARNNPLLNRRSPLGRATGAKSTTTTAAPEIEDEEEIPEDELVDEEVVPETSSTTEPPRKLKGGIVRPFRSNDDLLAILKKRREQAVNNKHAKAEAQESSPVGTESEKPAPKTRTSGGSRGRYNKKEANNEEEPSSSTAATRTSGRRFRN